MEPNPGPVCPRSPKTRTFMEREYIQAEAALAEVEMRGTLQKVARGKKRMPRKHRHAAGRVYMPTLCEDDVSQSDTHDPLFLSVRTENRERTRRHRHTAVFLKKRCPLLCRRVGPRIQFLCIIATRYLLFPKQRLVCHSHIRTVPLPCSRFVAPLCCIFPSFLQRMRRNGRYLLGCLELFFASFSEVGAPLFDQPRHCLRGR